MRGVARMLLVLGVVTLAAAHRQTSHLEETQGTAGELGELTHDTGAWPHSSRRSSRQTNDPSCSCCHRSEDTKTRPRHCKDILDFGNSMNGVYTVYPYHNNPQHEVKVYCVQDVDGGGWTVIQRRTDFHHRRENFTCPWTDYEKGFGDLMGEFWLGLEVMHELTSKGDQVLRVDLEDWEGERRFAQYDRFAVGSPASKYRLSIGRYSGSALDSFGGDGSMFTTFDNDNDAANYNCAEKFRGGWWYKSCHFCNLNGYPYSGRNDHYGQGITWFWWKGNYYSLRKTRMMIRPA